MISPSQVQSRPENPERQVSQPASNPPPQPKTVPHAPSTIFHTPIGGYLLNTASAS